MSRSILAAVALMVEITDRPNVMDRRPDAVAPDDSEDETVARSLLSERDPATGLMPPVGVLMRTAMISAVFLTLLVASNAQAQDRCLKEWIVTHDGVDVVKFQTCVYASGGSGWYEIDHLVNQEARFCWTIVFADGTDDSGCKTLAPLETRHRASCFRCAPDNSGGGAVDLIVRRYGDDTPTQRSPDLVVGPPSVSDSSPAAGAVFTLLATVRNGGDGHSAASTLRYYRSANATITRFDTAVGTDPVAELAPSAAISQSMDVTAPGAAGTYYYGACVDAVAGESDPANNCSSSVQVDVLQPVPALPPLAPLLVALGLAAAGMRLVTRRRPAASRSVSSGA